MNESNSPINNVQTNQTKSNSMPKLTISDAIADTITDATIDDRYRLIGQSPHFINALKTANKVAKSCANIFISGESGTGKEVFARYIHQQSRRSTGPFIAINCSAIPENLLESELFGHAKGSFTGAFDKKIGLFEEAQNGTLFLDEIGDLSLTLQAKLLRVLQDKKIRRVGENIFREINARIISATNKNLGSEINSGNFREDLFYRLSVIPLELPPLRDRTEDILPLAEGFLKKFSRENHCPVKYFANDAVDFLLENNWRGNVRELENAIERAVVMCTDRELHASDFSTSILVDDGNSKDSSAHNFRNNFVLHFEDHLPLLEEVLQKYVDYAVTFNGGAKDRTAKEIGIDRKTLYKKLKAEIAENNN